MKKILIALFLSILLCFALAACGEADKPEADTTTDAESTFEKTTEAESTAETTQQTEPVAVSEETTGWNVTVVPDAPTFLFDDGYGNTIINKGRVKLSDDGLHYKNIVTGKDTVILKQDYVVYAFNGKTILYCLERVDPTVDFDKDYVFAYEGEGAIKAEAYTVDDVMEYDIATGKTKKIFTKYCSGGGIVYYNDNAIYYEDIKESQIGYKNGYDPYALCLYSFDRKTGKRQLILEDSFGISMKSIDGKPCIETEDGIIDISTAEPVNLFEGITGRYHWSDGKYVYTIENLNGEYLNGFEEIGTQAIWAYNMANGTQDKLLEFDLPENAEYLGNEFLGRYVICGADITSQENEYTVSYSAEKYTVYDLLKRKTIVVNADEYDELRFVNGVMITWIDFSNGEYQINYYDDDGNHEYYETWKVNGELYSITPEGYYVITEQTEDMDLILEFVEHPIEFLNN